MTRHPDRFDRLPPATRADETVTREAVVEYFADRFGIPRATWTGYGFWRKGAEKIWAYAGELDGAIRTESLGMAVLRVGGEHWKPTTDGIQRFGTDASRNVIALDAPRARRFLAGQTQEIPWDGDWGYVIVSHRIGGAPEPIGVGLYTYGELRSTVPKGRRRSIDEPSADD